MERRSWVGLAAALAMIAGCGQGAHIDPAAPPADLVVGVRVQSLLVGVSTTGLEWDSLFHVASDLAAALTTAAGYPEASSIVSRIVAALTAPEAAPDPAGDAEILIDGVAMADLTLPEEDDTFQTSYANRGWDAVPIGAHDVRVELHVRDIDSFGGFEPIATVQLDRTDLIEALNDGHVFQVRVSSQSNGQLVYVGVSVIEQ